MNTKVLTHALFISFWTLTSLSLTAPLAQAETSKNLPRLAVMDLNNKAQLSLEESLYLTDLLRRIIIDQFKGKISVLTKENIMVLLPPGRRPEDCEGQCEVETGRLIGVDYILTGSIIKFGTSYRASLKLHNVRSGELLGAEMAGAKDLLSLEQEIQVANQKLMRKIRSQSSSADTGGIKRQKIGGEAPKILSFGGGRKMIVTLRSEPVGASVSVDGALVCSEGQAECRYELEEGAHDITMALKDFFEKSATVTFEKGKTESLSWALEPNFFTLRIKTKPSSLSYKINGQVRQGNTEFRAKPKTEYKIISSDPCFATSGEVVSAPRGETIEVVLEPQPLQSKLELSAIDSDQNPVAADIFLDGQALGTTPLRKIVSSCAKELKAKYQNQSEQKYLTLKAGDSHKIKLEFDTSEAKRKAEEERLARSDIFRQFHSYFGSRKIQGMVALQGGALISQHDQARPTIGINGGFKGSFRNSNWYWSLTTHETLTFGGNGIIGGLIEYPVYVLPASTQGVGYCWVKSCFWFNLHLLGTLFHPLKFSDAWADFLPRNQDDLRPQAGFAPVSIRYSYAFSAGTPGSFRTMSYMFLELKTMLIPMKLTWYETPKKGYYFDGYTTPPLFVSAGIEFDWRSR